MSYIIPDGLIQLFSDIGISPNYDNCLYFATTAEKDNYFDALPKIATFTSCSYSRQQRGYIRVDANISRVYNAGYMRFKNTSFENKWFYAFVTSVEYIANNTTQINFELDIMTTWMGTFNLGQCFIERQHVENDGIGINIADEGLNIGDYVIENFHDYCYDLTSNVIVFVESSEKGGNGGGVTGGIYNGCQLKYFPSAEKANEHINELIDANKIDNVIKIYMCPSIYYTPNITGNPLEHYNQRVDNAKPYTSLDGYVPKNNKLFTYPYKYAEINTSEGDRKDFKYEYFNTVPGTISSGNYSFSHQAICASTTEALFMPINYKVQTMTSNQLQVEERVSISNFPLCSYNIDTYRAYTAQMNSNLPLSALNSFNAGVIGGISSGNPIGGIINGLTGAASTTVNTAVANLLGTTSFAPEMGTRNQGNQESDFLLASGNKGFRIFEKCITKNYAHMIDDYFTAFGYAIRNIGTPNMNARPHWTYVKTIDCIVHGDLPSEDAGIIENIFNNGVRFWKNHTEIGNYSLDNSPS